MDCVHFETSVKTSFTKNLYNEKEYFGIEVFKTYCECAIEDIPFLAEYIKNNMYNAELESVLREGE